MITINLLKPMHTFRKYTNGLIYTIEEVEAAEETRRSMCPGWIEVRLDYDKFYPIGERIADGFSMRQNDERYYLRQCFGGLGFVELAA